MIFVYRCFHCGHFETEHPIGHAPLHLQCPLCGDVAVRSYNPFVICIRRGRTDLDGSHLPETSEEKAYWRERAGVDVDKTQVAVNGFKR